MGKVREIGRVVSGKGAIEVATVRLEKVVVSGPIRGRRVRDQDIMPAHAIAGELNVVLPALGPARPRQALVEGANPTVAADGEGGVLGVRDRQQIG